MIQLQVDQTQVQQLAEWLASSGQRGSFPAWFFAVQFARALNCTVFEIEDMFCELDPDAVKTPRAEWLARAYIVQQAEIAAAMIIRTQPRLALAH